jgi:hypothetical protein
MRQSETIVRVASHPRPGNCPTEHRQMLLARKIVEAYLSAGIPARLDRGLVVVRRDRGWEGPFDPEELSDTHRGEIEAVRQRVSDKLAHYRILESLQAAPDPSEVMKRLARGGEWPGFDEDGRSMARRLRLDLDFLANPHYWRVAMILVRGA